MAAFGSQTVPGVFRPPARPRPGVALPLSIALHAALVWAAGHWAWTTWQERRPASEVVWLTQPLSPATDTTPVQADDAEAAPRAEAAVPLQPREAVAVPLQPPVRRARRAEPLTDGKSREAVATSPAVAPAAPVPRAPPRIDWEKERRRAAASVVRQRALRPGVRTFSNDEDTKRAADPLAAPPVNVPKDDCAIATGKLERFALQMIGRCVRDARGDLFAAIKPDYLKRHPVCEAPSDLPPTFVDARGHEHSTIKCRLVLGEE